VKIYCSDAQAPIQPGLFQIGKKRESTDTKGVYSCAYPGPSVHIRVNDWLGADLKIDKHALGRFAMRSLCGIQELEKR
jgi:hypothetical protein